MATEIFTTFIQQGSEKEVNISQKVRNDMKEVMTSQVVATMFQPAYQAVFLSLKMDVFPRFLRSPLWVKFVAQQNSRYLDQIGIHKSKINTVVLDVDDLERPFITDKDFEFAQFMLRDYVTMWELKLSEPPFQFYTANQSISTDAVVKKYGSMIVAKAVNEFEISPLQFVEIGSSSYFCM